jgi:hypothetical protein
MIDRVTCSPTFLFSKNGSSSIGVTSLRHKISCLWHHEKFFAKAIVKDNYLYFKFLKRGALAITTAVTKPHMEDYTNCHHLYTFIQRVAVSSIF